MHSLPPEIVSKIIEKSIQSEPKDFKNLVRVSTFLNNQCTLFKPFVQQFLVQNELETLKNRLKKIENEKISILPHKTYSNEINWVDRNSRALTNNGYQANIMLIREDYVKKCQIWDDAGAFELCKMHFSKLPKVKFDAIGLEDHEFYKSFFTFSERSLTKGFALLALMKKSLKIETLLNLQTDPYFAELLQEEGVPPPEHVNCCPRL